MLQTAYSLKKGIDMGVINIVKVNIIKGRERKKQLIVPGYYIHTYSSKKTEEEGTFNQW